VRAQTPNGRIKELIVLDNFDTLSLERKHTDWYFGVNGGVNLGVNFNDLKIPDIISSNKKPVGDKIINYNTGFSGGAFFGLYGEWAPIDEMWGASLKINFFDYRSANSESDAQKDTFKTIYKNSYDINYFTISPSVRYSLPVENLYLFSGLDLEFMLSSEVRGQKEFRNSALIDHEKILPVDPNSFRIAFHLGVGYDIFVADISRKARAYISPFLSLHIGSTEISDFGSARMPFITRVGASVKFNIDERKLDTLPVNLEVLQAPAYIASLHKEKGVSFTGFKASEIATIAFVAMPEPRIVQELKQDNVIKTVETSKVNDAEDSPVKKNIVINPKAPKILYFPSSENTSLSKVQKEYLDALVDYLQKNPKATVRITGHSDNAGTTDQNQKRSESRANSIVQYMVKKNIPRRRLLDRGRGALEPIADNASEKGRAKNRRVEVQIVQ
jgi:outer membrane protein OmpA-like peptidoglycan-associated protein